MNKIYGEDIVREVQKYRGYPYRYGAEFECPETPTSFDCSELVEYVMESLGYEDFPDGSYNQYLMCKRYNLLISLATAAHTPGALVFMRSQTTKGVCHVGIVGENGTWEARGRPYSRVGKWPWRADWCEAGLIPGVLYEPKPKEEEENKQKPKGRYESCQNFLVSFCSLFCSAFSKTKRQAKQ